MDGIIDYLISSPEAVVALVVFAVGGVASTIVWLISIFARHPIVARVVASRSLVHVDSALREKVQVTFSHKDGIVDVKELRQIDYEILNSHPRRSAENCAITFNLCSADAIVLGVSATNSDGRTPRLGGRRIVASVESVPVQPADPMLGLRSEELFPAVVVRIPYLEQVVKNDRVFLRITYSGPALDPEVQGAKSVSSKRYKVMVMLTGFIVAFGCMGTGFALNGVAYSQEGIPMFAPTERWIKMRDNPYVWVALALMLIAYVGLVLLVSMPGWLRRFVRTLPNLLVPPRIEADSLAGFHYSRV